MKTRALGLGFVFLLAACGSGSSSEDGVAGSAGSLGSAGTGGSVGGSGGSVGGAGGAAGVAGSGGAQAGLTVTLMDGIVEGEMDGATRRFLGIPFAAPPVGDLRWKPPVKPAPWDGTLGANAFSSDCPQFDSIVGPPSRNEDCLYLNVWTPADAPSEPLPVMLWIHGGGNTSGSAAPPTYHGRVFAETRGVVLVSINYRLGTFGFFAHPALDAEDPRGVSGNQGLMDQRLALEWVRDNIASFGGDPSNVTIFGESAGSFDVCMHMVSPASRGLFHRAISQSGGCTTRRTPRTEAQAEVPAFVDAVGCGGASDELACLRGKSVDELMISATLVNEPPMPLPGGSRYQGATALWDFNLIVDGDVLPDQPRALFDAGNVAMVPYLIGSNSDEGTLFHIGATPVTTEQEYLDALSRAYGAEAATIAAAYPVSNFSSPNDALMRVTGDSGLVCGTYDSAIRAAAAGVDVFLYNFSRFLSPDLGATHAIEIQYVFGSDRASMAPEDQTLSEAMQGYWTRFAAAGDPNEVGTPAGPIWPKFDSMNDQRLNFDVDITLVDDFRATECAMWRALYDARF